jgi:hypothetical protein
MDRRAEKTRSLRSSFYVILCRVYSKILLIRLARDQTGTELSNIPDYQTALILT